MKILSIKFRSPYIFGVVLHSYLRLFRTKRLGKKMSSIFPPSVRWSNGSRDKKKQVWQLKWNSFYTCESRWYLFWLRPAKSIVKIEALHKWWRCLQGDALLPATWLRTASRNLFFLTSSLLKTNENLVE